MVFSKPSGNKFFRDFWHLAWLAHQGTIKEIAFLTATNVGNGRFKSNCLDEYGNCSSVEERQKITRSYNLYPFRVEWNGYRALKAASSKLANSL